MPPLQTPFPASSGLRARRPRQLTAEPPPPQEEREERLLRTTYDSLSLLFQVLNLYVIVDERNPNWLGSEGRRQLYKYYHLKAEQLRNTRQQLLRRHPPL